MSAPVGAPTAMPAIKIEASTAQRPDSQPAGEASAKARNCTWFCTSCFSEPVCTETPAPETSKDVCGSCVKGFLRATGQWFDSVWNELKTWATKLWGLCFAKAEKAPEAPGDFKEKDKAVEKKG